MCHHAEKDSKSDIQAVEKKRGVEQSLELSWRDGHYSYKTNFILNWCLMI